jgi:hypothetical protein
MSKALRPNVERINMGEDVCPMKDYGCKFELTSHFISIQARRREASPPPERRP